MEGYEKAKYAQVHLIHKSKKASLKQQRKAPTLFALEVIFYARILHCEQIKILMLNLQQTVDQHIEDNCDFPFHPHEQNTSLPAIQVMTPPLKALVYQYSSRASS